MDNNFYETQRYRTEKKIDQLHDVKYNFITSEEEFETALEELHQTNYVSITAEKQRNLYYKEKIKIIGTQSKKLEKFKALVNSFLHSLNSEWNIDTIKDDMYQERFGNIHKFIYDEEKQIFWSWYIHDDIIYTDKFEIWNFDKATSKFYIEKSMKTPIPMERMSLTTTMVRYEYRRNWKRFIKEVKDGLK